MSHENAIFWWTLSSKFKYVLSFNTYQLKQKNPHLFDEKERALESDYGRCISILAGPEEKRPTT